MINCEEMPDGFIEDKNDEDILQEPDDESNEFPEMEEDDDE